MTSQELILAQMHALDDVTAVIEHTPDVLCVHRTCEMWVAVVLAITTCCADTLQKFTNQFQLYSIYITMLPEAHDVEH
jgi:methylglyoxal synthase